MSMKKFTLMLIAGLFAFAGGAQAGLDQAFVDVFLGSAVENRRGHVPAQLLGGQA